MHDSGLFSDIGTRAKQAISIQNLARCPPFSAHAKVDMGACLRCEAHGWGEPELSSPARLVQVGIGGTRQRIYLSQS